MYNIYLAYLKDGMICCMYKHGKQGLAKAKNFVKDYDVDIEKEFSDGMNREECEKIFEDAKTHKPFWLDSYRVVRKSFLC